MKIALAQPNPIIGDFEFNFKKIKELIKKAEAENADLVIFPELSIMGYPPLDFLNRGEFVGDSLIFLEKIKRLSDNIGIILGAVTLNYGKGKPFYNSMLFYHKGKKQYEYHKRLLPTYDVFDEARYFEPGEGVGVVNIGGLRIGLTICEDIWTEKGFNPFEYRVNPVEELIDVGVDIIINISASPYYIKKIEEVKKLISIHCTKYSLPMLYINQVGGNDELIFQGHSMVFDKTGHMIKKAKDFHEDLIFWNTKDTDTKDENIFELNTEDELISALCVGISDYCKKLNFKKVLVGLSGGIDSSVVAALAQIALGKENVMGVAMPGPYNSPESLEDARELASNLGIRFEVVSISSFFKEAKDTLKGIFNELREDVTEENIQSRLRGVILMAISNKFGYLLLNTGNKSELAVGYCTLYGDTNGALSILGDVKKTMVYRIAHRINERFSYIPERVLIKPPSAELRPDQKDEDSLPPYDLLDKIIERYIEQGRSGEEIIQELGNREIVKRALIMIKNNEYKRRQTPPVLKVTKRAFGLGWRFPIAHGYRPIYN